MMRNTFSAVKDSVGKNLEHRSLFILQVLWNYSHLFKEDRGGVD